MSKTSNWPFLVQKDVNQPHGQHVNLKNLGEVSRLIVKNNYSGGIYKGYKRSLANWKKSNILILDIDEPQKMGMLELSETLRSLKPIIAPTKSNMISKNGKEPCERYRLLLFLNDYVYSSEMYKEIAIVFAKRHGLVIDTRAIDASHFFFKSTKSEYVNESGDLLSVRDLVDEAIHSQKPNLNDLWGGYKLSCEEIPKSLKKLIQSQSTSPIRSKFEEFIRILMAQHNLVRFDENKEYIGEGKISISQTHFAKELRVDVRTFRKWIKLLLEHKQLRIYSSHYGKGWTARKYAALGDLKLAIIKSYKGLNVFNNESDLPTYIDDGDYDRVLFWAAKVFQNDASPERYFNWARTLPGFNDKPDREHHLQHKWYCVKKYKDEN